MLAVVTAASTLYALGSPTKEAALSGIIEGVTARERRYYQEHGPLRTPPARETIEEDRVRFTHVGTSYDIAEYATFGDAVAAARQSVREIDGCPGTFTRAFVALRQRSNTSDRELVRWEVFTDRVVLEFLGG